MCVKCVFVWGHMEHIIEAILEALFGLAKTMPDEMPEIKYTDAFVIKYPAKKTVLQMCTAAVLLVVFSLLWFFVKEDTRYIFAFAVGLLVILLMLLLFTYSFKCTVDEECLHRSYFGMLEKETKWKEILCVRIIEQKAEKAVLIVLYDKEGKCVLDFHTDMQNAWYIVKMAEHKGIEIRKERELTLKQIRKL